MGPNANPTPRWLGRMAALVLLASTGFLAWNGPTLSLPKQFGGWGFWLLTLIATLVFGDVRLAGPIFWHELTRHGRRPSTIWFRRNLPSLRRLPGFARGR